MSEQEPSRAPRSTVRIATRRRARPRHRGLAALAALLGGVGSASAAEVPAASAEAPRASDFVLRSVGGPNVRMSEHVGDVIVLSFFSSRCNVCRDQLASLDRAYATYRPAGFQVLGISVDDDGAGARNFAATQRVSFPMLLDPSKAVARAYRVDDLPMLVAIDRFGAIRFVLRGNRRDLARDYVQDLRRLIDE